MSAGSFAIAVHALATPEDVEGFLKETLGRRIKELEAALLAAEKGFDRTHEPAARLVQEMAKSYFLQATDAYKSPASRTNAYSRWDVLNTAAAAIRALPNPPSEMPVFTAEDFYGAVAKLQIMAERCAAVANARLAAHHEITKPLREAADEMAEALDEALKSILAEFDGLPSSSSRKCSAALARYRAVKGEK